MNGGAAREGGQPGAPGVGPRAGAHREPHPDAAGVPEADRDREGEARDRDGELVRPEGVAPSRPARSVTSAKIPTSAAMCRPTGRPTRTAARSSRPSGVRARARRAGRADGAGEEHRLERGHERGGDGGARGAQRRDHPERARRRPGARPAEHEHEVGRRSSAGWRPRWRSPCGGRARATADRRARRSRRRGTGGPGSRHQR